MRQLSGRDLLIAIAAASFIGSILPYTLSRDALRRIDEREAAFASALSGDVGDFFLGDKGADADVDANAGTDADADSRRDLPIIIGGTDGSGTRSIVCLLDSLGTPMIVENPKTLDVEASGLGAIFVNDPTDRTGRRKVKGWPVSVHETLGRTRSADYDASDLPPDVQARFRPFWNAMRRRGRASRSRMGSERATSGVDWGFKAPVSMLLLPLFHRSDEIRGFKFLHVVRDGRDIAFSGNQSPVQKFYNLTFPPENDGGERWSRHDTTPEARAIELWSTWNTQVLRWEKRTMEVKSTTGAKFDYMVVHVEDLAANGPEMREAVIAKIARFVGSKLSPLDICCLANQEQKSLGSHTKGETSAVGSRFGKWKNLVTNETLTLLNQVGSAGLETLGYDPYDRPADQALPSSNLMSSCDAATCRSHRKNQPEGILGRICQSEGNLDKPQDRQRRKSYSLRDTLQVMNPRRRSKRGRHQ